jgi:Trk K+ transport system NAD-binding subunit/Kef-type K+ transport system membrane component KefB
VIALVAGAELLLTQLRPRLKAIGATVGGIVVFGYFVLATAIYVMAPLLPFTADFDQGARLALALLGAAVLLALSPPSAIAVVKEVRARGRFTRTVLGVTVLMDVAIIVLFAAMTSVASPLLEGTDLDLSFLGLLALDLASALIVGVVLGVLIATLLSTRLSPIPKTLAVLALGFGVYELADWVRSASVEMVGFEVYIEPLLISLIAGLYVANFSRHREQFDRLLHGVSPIVYVAFFTITGISLKLDLLLTVLPFALGLFAIRVAGIGLGSTLGGRFAGEPARHRRYSWMAYITQAGIALGLAREVAVQFPSLGDAFATLIISVVVINELAGPLFLKTALRRVGETHEPGVAADGGRVLVFGTGDQAVETARALHREGQKVMLVANNGDESRLEDHDFSEEVSIEDVDDATLGRLFDSEVSGVIAMLDDDDANAEIIRYAAEHHGISRLVVRPSSVAQNARFEPHGAVVVHPTTGLVALLAQAVLTPNATSLLLQHDRGREIFQVPMTNPDLDGMSVASLRLPPGVLLMEVRRGQSVLLVDGRTRLQEGDELTLIASDEARAEMQLVFTG